MKVTLTYHAKIGDREITRTIEAETDPYTEVNGSTEVDQIRKLWESFPTVQTETIYCASEPTSTIKL